MDFLVCAANHEDVPATELVVKREDALKLLASVNVKWVMVDRPVRYDYVLARGRRHAQVMVFVKRRMQRARVRMDGLVKVAQCQHARMGMESLMQLPASVYARCPPLVANQSLVIGVKVAN
jgi:hypothetical protein